MSLHVENNLRRRAEYTYRPNLKIPRHGWLRLTPAYSVKVVEELLVRCGRPMRILDPFAGTATTALCSAYRGHQAVTMDINPFLVWLGRAKTARYSRESIQAAQDACAVCLSLLEKNASRQAAAPPIHNIERWWSPAKLRFLRSLRGAVDATTAKGSPEQTLLLVSFCRTLIKLSNAAFNHQSMSFKNQAQRSAEPTMDLAANFAAEVRLVLKGAAQNPRGSARVILGDARRPSNSANGRFDRVITSPPYANRMSYIRELRPYMYWLGFLTNGRDAGELDWSSIGGTWGVATSRLNDWSPEGKTFFDPLLAEATQGIASPENKNGRLLSRYVAKYFDDMWKHFQSLVPTLAPRAEIHYIVGNSTFYGVLLPVEQIYASMLRRLGFQQIQHRPLRKRNSKKELIEFDVSARWPGD